MELDKVWIGVREGLDGFKDFILFILFCFICILFRIIFLTTPRKLLVHICVVCRYFKFSNNKINSETRTSCKYSEISSFTSCTLYTDRLRFFQNNAGTHYRHIYNRENILNNERMSNIMTF